MYEGCQYWKKLKQAIWGVHHINVSHWYNQTLRLFLQQIVIIYEGIHYDSLYMRVVSIEKFALLDWYNQTLRFSCNNIVITYEQGWVVAKLL